MKVFRAICVVGLALCLTTSVYAGTQSVKISGDLTVRSVIRDDYDLAHDHHEAAIYTSASGAENLLDVSPGHTSDFETYFMTTTELQVDADLTDNVSAVIRLFNQRDWNTRDSDITEMDRDKDAVILPILRATDADEFDIGVDLAYIELKEFLYSPLTLRIGRQDLWFGKGFVVGANLQDLQGTINADEYTSVTSFDAIRATLDYDPWTIDAVAASIWENEIGSYDDETLVGLNVGYIFDSYNAEAEAYWFHKDDKSTVPARAIKQHNSIHTIGVRGSADPIENWTVAVEGAFQFGHFVGFRDQLEKRGRQGYALDASAECRHFRDQFEWKPVIGAEYILYSGDDDPRDHWASSSLYQGWDPMYRGKFDTAYREFVGVYNVTHQGVISQQLNYINPWNDTSITNQHQVIAYGSLMPTDSLTVDGRVAFFWQQEHRSIPENRLDPAGNAVAGSAVEDSKRDLFLGTEIDVQLTWDYTEDVSFGVLAAWFIPGGFYYDGSDDTATDLVGTVKLSF